MLTEIIFLNSVLDHNNHIEEDLVNRHSASLNYLHSLTYTTPHEIGTAPLQ